MMIPLNILIVDDRPENIITLEALLQRPDIRIFSTTSPNEALKIAWENSISIALIDVQMPEMDGFELVEMLKSNPKTKDILVIFVTAISKEAKYAVKGLNAGAVDYLYKPLDPYITSAKVDAFIQLARSQKEIKIKNEELENHALIVKNSADIICTIDAQSLRIVNINPAVEKILGYKASEVIDRSIIDLVIEDRQIAFKTQIGEVIRENSQSSAFEFQFQTFNRNYKWMECRASCRGKSIFINISDISPQKSYMEQLIKSKEAADNARKIKESFLANMSHELRTPISGIIGLSNILRDTELNDQQNGLLDLLEVSSQSLLGVINDILDISKIEAGKFTIVRSPNNVAEICRAVCGLLKFKADEKNIEMIIEIDPNIPKSLMVDSLRLNQILMNLLSNAIKFTDAGYVKLKVSIVEQLETKCKLSFIVEDTGIGIQKNRLPKVFNSFEQAEDDTSIKYGGTGLGLAIVKKLVELKGGDLRASSEIGKGSTFEFINSFKVSDTVIEQPKERVRTKDLSSFENIRVLVAEDNLVNQFMISKILKDWQAHVDIVNNGRKVLEKLEEYDYDIILMDIHMPEMDGLQAAKLIRINFDEPKRSIPIISLSAAQFESNREQAVGSGMNEAVTKPFQPYELHEKMKKLLEIKLA